MQKTLFQDTKLAHLFSFLAISILPVLVCIVMLGANNLSTYKSQQDSAVRYGMQDVYKRQVLSVSNCRYHTRRNGLCQPV